MNRGAGWEPSTEAEVALYDALVTGDQEKYFRALGRTELLLPVSADAVAGRSPMGWATWTSNDHTHLLAFTSTESMRTCLAEHAGAARRMSFPELSAAWPNQDWWLAVNPGLPIEGYLPSWFVVQLGKGDARLPGQKSSAPRDRLARVEALERAKAARAAAQHPRELREPVRVSATVAPRALPSAPAQSEPAPASSVWTESTPVATPWLQPPRAEPHAPPYSAPLPQRVPSPPPV
ncbi:MAG TPA: hypothetical protein DGG94_15920 [Micromonosporaceae bacterium]|nr:hypothetical protein [Micromonosporaceae bacterium]